MKLDNESIGDQIWEAIRAEFAAAAHASSGNDRTLVGSAYRALMATYPDLGKAYVMERLAGIDRLASYLVGRNDY